MHFTSNILRWMQGAKLRFVPRQEDKESSSFQPGNTFPVSRFDVGLELLLAVSPEAALGYVFRSMGLTGWKYNPVLLARVDRPGLPGNKPKISFVFCSEVHQIPVP